MHIHDHRPLAGELRRIGAIEEPRHGQSVKAFDRQQFRFNILRHIQTAGFAFGPAGHLQRFWINAVRVSRAACRGESHPDLAPLGDFEPANDACG